MITHQEDLDPPQIFTRHDHHISNDDIDDDALKIIHRLQRSGHKAYLVGGGVRDLLLGKVPKDYDIATDATPRLVKELFRNSRIIGRRFKLVHIFFGGGKNIQVATFRDSADPIDLQDDEEVALSLSKEHRIKQDNKYGTEATDAHRRDITINGLFYDPDTSSIIDYVGGMDDLRGGIIRVIGDPESRFVEDPVRLIRVVRHAARAGFSIDPRAAEAIVKSRALLSTCSPMRVYEEVKKDLTSGSSLSIFRLLAQCQLLDLLLPELTDHDLFHLSERSPFPAALRRADALLRGGADLSVSSLLALIALYHGYYKGLGDPFVRFEDEDSIFEHQRSCFTSIAIPKRERERLFDLLCGLRKLINEPQKLKVHTLERQEVLDELRWLVQIYLPERPELLDLLVAQPRDRNNEFRGDGRRDRSRRRRGPRRRRGDSRDNNSGHDQNSSEEGENHDASDQE